MPVPARPKILPPNFEPWVLYRYGKGPKPDGIPNLGLPQNAWWFDELLKFTLWRAWLSAGRPKPRPSTFWKTVAKESWQNRILAAVGLLPKSPHPTPPPPPKPTPPPHAEPLPFELPLAMPAWEMQNLVDDFDDDVGSGSRKNFNGQGLAAVMQACATPTVVVQLGEIDQGTSDLRRCVFRQDVDALKNAGIEVFAWDDLPEDVGRIRALLDELGIPEENYVPQVESDAQMQRLLNYQRAGLPIRACVGTVPTAPPPEVFERGCRTILVECYGPEGYPLGDVARMLWQFHDSAGWPNAVALLGLYHGYGIDRYLDTGRRFGWWTPGMMQPSDVPLIRARATSLA